jgi:glycosyltransferase involved in cell wall biosynthesis
MPFISVVIPAFNRTALLLEALESVFAQTFTDYEVIVVDDGSTDDTESMLRSFGKPIQLYQQQNRGPGAARNLGARNAVGDYMAFLDSDDIWFPWTLQTYCNVLKQGNTPGFIVGKPFDFTIIDDLTLVKQTRLSVSAFPDYLSAGKRPGFTILTCSSVVVRREKMLSMGGFSEQDMNAEDSDLWLKLGLIPGFKCIEDPPTCGYRRHRASAVANLEKTWCGLNHVIETEAACGYPGGWPRRKERWEIITRHVRPASLSLLRNREFKKALPLYARTWLWNYQLGRMKYLVGFWFYFLRSAVVCRKHS